MPYTTYSHIFCVDIKFNSQIELVQMKEEMAKDDLMIKAYLLIYHKDLYVSFINLINLLSYYIILSICFVLLLIGGFRSI